MQPVNVISQLTGIVPKDITRTRKSPKSGYGNCLLCFDNTISTLCHFLYLQFM